MAANSSVLAWEIPQEEEPGGLQSMGHKELDVTERLTHLFAFISLNWMYHSLFVHLSVEGHLDCMIWVLMYDAGINICVQSFV